MAGTRKRVPAKRHDPEMDNYVYQGGQSLRGKGRRDAAESANKSMTSARNGRPSEHEKQ